MPQKSLFIATESKTNIRELIGVLNRVVTFSKIHKKTLTIGACKNILKDVINQAKIITVGTGRFNVGKVYMCC